ncbi:MAG: hypothetical protein U9Q71_06420 [Pseudomonadota bacterium]|nr:hypothetical protein [Pseudomonadota bacterium]
MSRTESRTRSRTGITGITGNAPHAGQRYGRLSGLGKLQPNVDPVRVYEARIATRLAGGSAIYCERQQILYFHDSSEKRIDDAVSLVMQGLGRPTRSQPVRIDDEGYFRVARKIMLRGRAYSAVISALRLLGVEVKRIGLSDSPAALIAAIPAK